MEKILTIFISLNDLYIWVYIDNMNKILKIIIIYV